MENLKYITNGQAVQHTFSQAELTRRQTQLRQLMVTKNIDTAIFTSIHNINYYSDFLYCAFGRPYALVIDQDNATTLSANIDGGQPYRRTFGDNLVYTDWQRDNFFLGLKKLVSHAKGRIGIEFDHLSLERYNQIKALFPQAEIIDIAACCMQLRMVKSEEEIAHIKQGAAVCDVGGLALVEAVQEGIPEYEVALHTTQAMVREIAKHYPHSELMDTWTWFQSGINTDGAHNPVTSRRVQKGDILSLNCFSMIAGYYTALERTLFYHHCDDASLKIWKANIEVHEAGLKLIKPGMRCCDIACELNEIFKQHGLLDKRTFGYGHSFGVLSHYYGREAGLELREDIETVLEPNMVISMEPMVMIEEGQEGAGGYREHDILIVTEEGNENITQFPYGPEHNIL